MKTKGAPSWLKLVRAVGVILGVFFVFCAVGAEGLASDADPHPTAVHILLRRCLFAIAALPLLVRWRSIRSDALRRSLIFVLAADALYFTYCSAESIFWAFHHGEGIQLPAFILVGLFITAILFAQFPAVSRLSNAPQPNAG